MTKEELKKHRELKKQYPDTYPKLPKYIRKHQDVESGFKGSVLKGFYKRVRNWKKKVRPNLAA